MKKYFFVILLLSAYLAFYYGCNDTTTSTGDIKQVDPTILRTDEFGNELGGDTTDWCNGSQFAFNPSYPNPTNDTFNIRLSIPVTDTISLYFLNSSADTLFILRDQQICTRSLYSFIQRPLIEFSLRNKEALYKNKDQLY